MLTWIWKIKKMSDANFFSLAKYSDENDGWCRWVVKQQSLNQMMKERNAWWAWNTKEIDVKKKASMLQSNFEEEKPKTFLTWFSILETKNPQKYIYLLVFFNCTHALRAYLVLLKIEPEGANGI